MIFCAKEQQLGISAETRCERCSSRGGCSFVSNVKRLQILCKPIALEVLVTVRLGMTEPSQGVERRNKSGKNTRKNLTVGKA